MAISLNLSNYMFLGEIHPELFRSCIEHDISAQRLYKSRNTDVYLYLPDGEIEDLNHIVHLFYSICHDMMVLPHVMNKNLFGQWEELD